MHPRLRSRLILSLAFITALAAVSGSSRKLAANTINPTATLEENGAQITLTGPITCTQTERVALRVIVTQRTTGAIAEGAATFIGSTTSQEWTVTADVRGGADFEPGPVTAVAIAVTSLRGQHTDAHQWLVPVNLQE